MGWSHHGKIPDDVHKCILVGAQHTSNWDFIPAIGCMANLNRNPKFLIKKEWWKFPFNILMKALGGIPVDRGKKNNMIEAMVDLINDYDDIVILMAPEGTRSYAKKWKSGFYHVALKANIPIVLGSLDFEKKESRIGPVFIPTGNQSKDLIEIKKYYSQFTPRHPKNGIKPEDII